jgi:hypothetical protein
MEAAQDLSNQEKDHLAGDVMDSLGEPEGSAESASDTHDVSGGTGINAETLSVQKRLKAQRRAHEREIRALHARIESLQHSGQPITNDANMSSMTNPYMNGTNGNNAANNGNIAEHIHNAVNYALQHKEMKEREVKDAEQKAHVAKQYGELQKHLDHVSDKYDDFDDVVRGEDVPFTPHMRDAALLLPRSGPGSAGEVLYKLGKPANRDELERIRHLHPLEQARELNQLSHALANSGESRSHDARPIGNIKSNPVVNSHAITDKTPASEIRARMKAGKFK